MSSRHLLRLVIVAESWERPDLVCELSFLQYWLLTKAFLLTSPSKSHLQGLIDDMMISILHSKPNQPKNLSMLCLAQKDFARAKIQRKQKGGFVKGWFWRMHACSGFLYRRSVFLYPRSGVWYCLFMFCALVPVLGFQ